MDYEEWVNMYKPIKNHLAENASVDGFLFMHYEKEWDFVSEFNCNQIWSLIITDLDGDKRSWDILNGVRIVNREGYFVTKVLYNEETPLIITY